MSRADQSIDYIELPMADVEATKAFYAQAFGWAFQDWGPTYVSFSGAGVDGGFSGERKPAEHGRGVFVVLFAADLKGTLARVQAAGGTISKDLYGFPGGRRFHFVDPNGNELLVWGEAAVE